MASNEHIRKISKTRAEVYYLPISALTPKESFNHREDFGEINALVETIDNNPAGVIQPLTIENKKGADTLWIKDGERRYKACLLLAEKRGEEVYVPCIFEKKSVTPAQQLINQLVVNSGKSMTMIEKGKVYCELNDEHGMSMEDIGKAMGGVTKQSVSQAITIVKYGSAKILKMIRNDQVSASAALPIITAHKENKALQDSKILDELSSTKKVTKASTTKSVKKDKDKDGNEGDGASTETNADGTERRDTTKPPDFKAEREADDKANSGGGTGGGGGGGLGTKNPKIEDRHKNVEKMMEEINLDNCHSGHVASFEMLLTYLTGEGTITPLKKHLLGK